MVYSIGGGGYSPYTAPRPAVSPVAADATGLGGAGSVSLLGGAGSAGLLGGAPQASPLSPRSALAGPGAAGGGDPMIQFMTAFAQFLQAFMSMMSGGASPFADSLGAPKVGAVGPTGNTGTGNTGTGNTGTGNPADAVKPAGGGGGGY